MSHLGCFIVAFISTRFCICAHGANYEMERDMEEVDDMIAKLSGQSKLGML